MGSGRWLSFVIAAIAWSGCAGDDQPILPTEFDACVGPTCEAACGNTMFDPANCGWCGHACTPGASCDNGVCMSQDLAIGGTAGVGADQLALDGDYAYWTNHAPVCGTGGGTCDGIMKCLNTGCGLSPTQIGTFLDPKWIDIAGGVALVASATARPLVRCSLDGCGTSPATPADLPPTQNLVADANRVAWIDLSTLSSCPNSDADCPTPTVIATVPLGQQYSAALAVRNGNVYFATQSTIYVAPIDGSAAAQVVLGGLASIIALDADDEYLYYVVAGLVGRYPLAGGASSTITTSPSIPLRGLAVDDEHVYFATSQGTSSTIERCPKAGCVEADDRQVLVVDTVVDFEINDTQIIYTRGWVRWVLK